MQNRVLSPEAKRQIRDNGFGISGSIGGITRQKYFTPDGREILAIPSLRGYQSRDGSGGIRDANLDNGWLLQPPTDLKLYCRYCDKWHDTQADIDQCGKKRNSFISRYQKEAEKMTAEAAPAIAQLKSDMETMKQMLATLLAKDGGNNGSLFQPEIDNT